MRELRLTAYYLTITFLFFVGALICWSFKSGNVIGLHDMKHSLKCEEGASTAWDDMGLGTNGIDSAKLQGLIVEYYYNITVLLNTKPQ